MMRHLATLLLCLTLFGLPAFAQNGPLRIEITEGVIEPLPFAVPNFVPESGAAGEYGANIARVIADDLTGTGLFREVPASAFISQISDFAARRSIRRLESDQRAGAGDRCGERVRATR